MTDHTDIKDMKAWLAGERSGVSLAMNTARGGLRILETLGVVGRQGLGWMLGDRPPVPALLRTTFESLGTTYIKLGQFIASSPRNSTTAISLFAKPAAVAAAPPSKPASRQSPTADSRHAAQLQGSEAAYASSATCS